MELHVQHIKNFKAILITGTSITIGVSHGIFKTFQHVISSTNPKEITDNLRLHSSTDYTPYYQKGLSTNCEHLKIILSKFENIQGIWQSDSNLLDIVAHMKNSLNSHNQI